MAIYADHPYALIPTPTYQNSQNEKDAPDPDVFVRIASGMALIHNMAIRGLNSIYLQAPHVSASDAKGFLQYTLAWYSLLHVHHAGEEADFFPAVEELTGQKGLMDCNVSQHKEFHDGLEAFKTYVDACVSGKEKFDGPKLVTLIDGFGEVLTKHLGDEIPSILGLKLFGIEKMAPLEQKFAEEGEKSMKALGLIKGLPFCFSNHDVAFEGGLWASWPPAPPVVKLLCQHITYRLHTNWWKFAACDRKGNLKPLYAVPSEAARSS
ncbi:hemerythrin HHE cation binding domain-containing protein [Colletotrichum tofieldiae]|uniref:Hemerythrin HHE cation binding domain-containing protein n=1 Tax=Colletotrichum tofieldiae TaxID=708197 RepID=A0A166UNE8_9PEZI|nr:hemerythrin HHE cation binding domain-containing protein [Colletotrichum tofieldiae]GKT64227.1 hemerythrin HHE cation binding domain-containing protein [Colletotrichum tofieldiae]GKT74176.1 hemerythrin HHE cation binding domain-containing protein [Colletotrichum tofieldiae]GKT97100.1 hemerythrin HHE cation binding domain-containing protein [Colletotrichum tofieldiae]